VQERSSVVRKSVAVLHAMLTRENVPPMTPLRDALDGWYADRLDTSMSMLIAPYTG
jgi:hypothetical protein